MRRTRHARTLAAAGIPVLLGSIAASGQPGQVQWRLRIDDAVGSQFVEVGPDGTIYTAGGSATYAVNPDGTVRWTSPDAFGGYPIDFGADGTIYTALGIVGNEYALVVALNPDGSTRWRFVPPVAADAPLLGPNVGPDGNIYAVQEAMTWTGLGAFSLDPDGNLRWSNAGTPLLHGLTPTTISDIEFGADRLHFGIIPPRSGDNPVIYTFSLAGDQLWTSWDFGVHNTTFPAMDPADRVICGWGQTGIRALDPDGIEEWFRLHPNGISLILRPAVDSRGIIYTGDDIGGTELWSIDPDGGTRYVLPPTDESIDNIGLDPAETIIVGDGSRGPDLPQYIRAWNAADGEILWTVDLLPENGMDQFVSSYEPAFSADGCSVYVTARFAGSVNDYGYLYAVSLRDCGCEADFNGDGLATLDDFIAFRNHYTGGHMAADLDRSGTLTLNDFVRFRDEYVGGCP